MMGLTFSTNLRLTTVRGVRLKLVEEASDGTDGRVVKGLKTGDANLVKA